MNITRIPGIRGKIQHIWMYYKLWIIGAVVLVWFVSFAVKQYTTTLKDYWLYIMFTNTYENVGGDSDLYDGFLEYAGFDLKEKMLVFDNEAYFKYEKGRGSRNSYYEAFVAYEETGTLDAITMQKEYLLNLGATGRLLDLNAPQCYKIKEKYGGKFLYARPIDGGDDVAIGIDISDSLLMTKEHIYDKNDGCVLGIGAHSENLESIEMFLDYIYR